MRANRLVLAGSFCLNKDCPDYGLADHGNIVKFGRTAKAHHQGGLSRSQLL
jgi:hypothetical protein